MRVISGSARRLLLKTIDGMDTRPTTDRIKETLFNMINHGLSGANFLDLFSGSGAIGIEALSRGCKKAYFVENNRIAVDCIKENLKHTKLEDKAEIIPREAVSAIRMLEDKDIVFDFVFMDPPYGKTLELDVLRELSNSKIINEDTLIIIESDLATDFQSIDDIGFQIIKDKIYKTNKHTFIERKELL